MNTTTLNDAERDIDIDLAAIAEWQPPEAPVGWTRNGFGPGVQYVRTLTRESVIITAGRHLDGKRWLHFSMAHPSRMPHYTELANYKDVFLGREVKAVMVLPPRSQHVNIHTYCLHLFVCLDADPLPDFTNGSGSL